jgi:hypothetical protein
LKSRTFLDYEKIINDALTVKEKPRIVKEGYQTKTVVDEVFKSDLPLVNSHSKILELALQLVRLIPEKKDSPELN